MRVPEQLSNREARWLALAAQGLAVPRPSGSKRPGRAPLRRLLDELGTIQIDAVNVLARTQFLVPFSRVGAYDPAHLRNLTGPGGPWFEYWGHAASLMATDLYPLFRPRMKLWGTRPWSTTRWPGFAGQPGARPMPTTSTLCCAK
jgi:uncharacterized protein YcaQ